MPAGATYDSIVTTTLTAATNAIDLTSISGSYTDLRLILVCKNTTGNSNVTMAFNNTGAVTTYSQTRIKGDGSAAATNRSTNQSGISLNDNFNISTEWQTFFIDIFNYAGSTFKYCTISSNQDSNGSGQTGVYVGAWGSTSAITSVKLTISANNFAIGTSAALYGITKA